MEQVEKNYFEILNEINVSDKTEEKNSLTYLSWAWAWGEVKKKFPDANYKIYETENGCIYWNDGKTAWVKTGLTVNGIEHIEYLPIMDYRNKSISVENITSTDVNKTIQRSLTKAAARHGLGLYIYAGEDLPEIEKKSETEEKAGGKEPSKKEEKQQLPKATENQIKMIEKLYSLEEISKVLEIVKRKSLEEMTVTEASSLIAKRKKEEEK